MKHCFANRCNLELGMILAGILLVVVSPAHALEDKTIWPSPEWASAEPADVGLDPAKLREARDYALSAGGSGMIVRHGKVVLRWGDQAKKYDIKSATKSFGTAALGIAIKDGKLELDVPARKYHPTLGVPPDSNAATGWLDDITVLHLATQTAGFEKPGGYEKLLFKPGTYWHYSDGGPNWLAECITLQYKRDLDELMFERVFTPLGISRDDLQWRKNQYRPHDIAGVPRREFGAGIHANVEALSRFGYLWLRNGRWNDQQILPEEFVRTATRPIEFVVGLPDWDSETHPNAAAHYGLLFWTNGDGALKKVPRDAYWAWGLYDSLVVVIPSLDLVVVRGGQGGKSWPRHDTGEWSGHYGVLKPFLEPIVAAVSERNRSSLLDEAPYPPSSFVGDIQLDWSTHQRHAQGSDNFQLTWADDDHQYGAWGDGGGFGSTNNDGRVGLGFARVEGTHDAYRGINVWGGKNAENPAQFSGKSWGTISVGGTLYSWIVPDESDSGSTRDHYHSVVLARSTNHAASWTRANWRWQIADDLIIPTFLVFGKDNAGALDDYIYSYFIRPQNKDITQASHGLSVHRPGAVYLARVPKDRIFEGRDHYEWFSGMKDGKPAWGGLAEKQPVFEDPNGTGWCLSAIYDPGLKRCLLCTEHTASHVGSLGLFEAPEPWGPWTTVAYWSPTDPFGGSRPGSGLPWRNNVFFASFAPKWLSSDGQSFTLCFTGGGRGADNDSFNTVRGRFMIRPASEHP